MRIIATLPLFLIVAGCAQPSDVNGNNTVDIDAAAEQAQGSITAYHPTETPTPKASAPTSEANLPATSNASVPEGIEEPLAPPPPGAPGGLPDDRTPVSEAPFTPDSAQGAADVVQRYYALIGEGRYRQAWGLWSDDGKASGKSADAFTQSFAPYSEYHANIGAPSPVDAGAGQRYVTVPVQVYARLRQGRKPVYQIGTVTLHRTGDIDGATPAQKTWHLQQIALKPVRAH